MGDLLDILKSAAPALATAVMGPMGGMAVKAIADKLGVGGTVAEITSALQADPNLALKLKEIDVKEFEIEQSNLTERLKADMGSDSWLSKNIRPMTLMAILVGYFFFATLSAFDIETNSRYVELLGQWGMLIMSFYFGGRTLEKIIDMKGKK